MRVRCFGLVLNGERGRCLFSCELEKIFENAREGGLREEGRILYFLQEVLLRSS